MKRKMMVASASPPHVCDWNCYDWGKGSKALIASDGERSLIIEYVGGAIDFEICENGTSDLLDGFEPGLFVWEGNLVGSRDYWGEYDSELVGEIRSLTSEEWSLARDGDGLWDSEEYRSCKEATNSGDASTE